MNLNDFWARVAFTDDGCWLWTGNREVKGYGRLTWRRRAIKAHRLAYSWFVGPIPAGLTLDHLCRNRACVNPHHLEPVTNGENVLRGFGITARRKRQTHCVNGHEFTTENTYLRPEGHRDCRICRRDHNRRYRRSVSANRGAEVSISK